MKYEKIIIGDYGFSITKQNVIALLCNTFQDGNVLIIPEEEIITHAQLEELLHQIDSSDSNDICIISTSQLLDGVETYKGLTVIHYR